MPDKRAVDEIVDSWRRHDRRHRRGRGSAPQADGDRARAIARSPVTDLTVVATAGPTSACSAAAGKVARVGSPSCRSTRSRSSRTSAAPARPARSRPSSSTRACSSRPAGRGVAGAVPADPRRARLRRVPRSTPASHGAVAVRRRRGAGRHARVRARRRALPHEPGRPGRQRRAHRTRPHFDDMFCLRPRGAASCRSSRWSRPTNSPRDGCIDHSASRVRWSTACCPPQAARTSRRAPPTTSATRRSRREYAQSAKSPEAWERSAPSTSTSTRPSTSRPVRSVRHERAAIADDDA